MMQRKDNALRAAFKTPKGDLLVVKRSLRIARAPALNTAFCIPLSIGDHIKNTSVIKSMWNICEYSDVRCPEEFQQAPFSMLSPVLDLLLDMIN